MSLPNMSNAWRLFPHTYAKKASRGHWKPYDHLKYISRKIAHAVANGGGRIIVEAPPRHGKSELISHWVPTWFLDMYPHKRVILTSYESGIAEDWGRVVRNEIEHNEFVDVELRHDSTSAKRFNTKVDEGFSGGMICAGVGGPITGKGGDLIIIDDPVKNWEDAVSEVKRAKAKKWYESTLRTRAEPGATIVVLQTRWHEDDLAGWLQTEFPDEWEVIRFPAVAEESDVLGRFPGDPLCPERYGSVDLEKLKKSVGPRVWNALFQQRPSAEEGELWLRRYWKHWTALPEKFDEQIISGDLNTKEGKKNDWTRYQVWGRKGAEYFLIDQVSGQWGLTKQCDQLVLLAIKYPKARKKLIENKANGPAVEDALKKRVSGIILVEPKGGKVVRAQACEPLLVAGNVYLPPKDDRYPWVPDFIDEAASFPNGKNDDQVDSASQALIYFDDSNADSLRKLIRW